MDLRRLLPLLPLMLAVPSAPAAPLPAYAAYRDRLPEPICEEHPEWVGLYWKAWELAFHNFHNPAPGSGFVSLFIDAAFNQNIFLWDTCFMSMFCDVAHPLVPGICSLDNFYARQHPDGEISREINRATGIDYRPWIDAEGRSLLSRNGWVPPTGGGAPVIYRGRPAPATPPVLTLDALDNPLPAWAEEESVAITGDRERLARVYPPLQRYYRALRTYLRQGNGLYVTDWASMDNSPRNGWLTGGGTAVDTSAQMALFARELSRVARTLGASAEAEMYARQADEIGRAINRFMWDPGRRFYFDLSLDGRPSAIRTVAAYWTLLAGVASREQAADLVAALRDPHAFGTALRVPTLAADEPGFDPRGGYWRGSVWAPTTMMVIRGLERYGYEEEARSVALENLQAMQRVLHATGTIWENYAPDGLHQGVPAKGDFVGWSGLGPIRWLLEFGVGLKPDALANTLTWDLRSTQAVGCLRYRFNGHVMDLRAGVATAEGAPRAITVTSDGPFTLILKLAGAVHRIEIPGGGQASVLRF